MLLEDDPDQYEKRYIRQVLFNDSLEQIATIKNPDGRYVDPIQHISQHNFGEPVTWENISQRMPFLEVAVFYTPGDIDCHYSVFFHSASDLDNEMWKRIRDAVKSALHTVDEEEGGRLFFSKADDEAKMMARKDARIALARKRFYARLVQLRYKGLMDEIRALLAAKVPSAEIAAKYGVKKSDVCGPLDLKRPQIYEAAEVILQKELFSPLEMESPLLKPLAPNAGGGKGLREGMIGKILGKELGFEKHEMQKIKDEILNRGPRKSFRNRKETVYVSERATIKSN